jgi:hypothetical protein
MRANRNRRFPMKRLFPVLILGLALPAAAATLPLRDEVFVNGQLRAAQIGDILRKTCPAASARMFVVYGKLRALEAYARDHGYTEAEVEAFLDDPAEKARIKAEAQAYLAAAGAVEGDAESHCRVARDEVARGTETGQMLRVSE